MDADLLRALSTAAIASSVAVLLVCLFRRPLRAAVGARIAYWLWLLVPTLVLASLLPAPTQILYSASALLPDQVRSALGTVTIPGALPRGSDGLAAGLLTVWAIGACAMFALLLLRQRSFMRALGTLRPDLNGIQRSS